MKYWERSAKSDLPPTYIVILFIEAMRQNAKRRGMFPGGRRIGNGAKYFFMQSCLITKNAHILFLTETQY